MSGVSEPFLKAYQNIAADLEKASDAYVSGINKLAQETLKTVQEFDKLSKIQQQTRTFSKNIDIENDENHIKPDITTLQEILDLQEKIFEIDNLDEILVLKNNLNSQIKKLINDFQNAFAINKFNEATQFLIKAKYLKKSLIDLKNRQKNLN